MTNFYHRLHPPKALVRHASRLWSVLDLRVCLRVAHGSGWAGAVAGLCASLARTGRCASLGLPLHPVHASREKKSCTDKEGSRCMRTRATEQLELFKFVVLSICYFCLGT